MTDPSLGRHLRVVLFVFYAAILAAALYFIFKYLLVWFLPFIFAYLFACALEPLVRFMNKKLHINRKVAGIFCVIAVTTLLIMLINLLVGRALYELREFSDRLPEMAEALKGTLAVLSAKITVWLGRLPLDIAGHEGFNLLGILEDFLSNYRGLAQAAMSIARKVAGAVPQIFLFTVAFVVSTCFIVTDRENLSRFIAEKMPRRVKTALGDIKKHGLLTLEKYIRAQLILILITSAELFAGFTIIKVDYALILAAVIAVIDALPILGTGTVLIPWAVISVLIGNYYRGLALGILYLIVLFVRQSLEPKIVGESIGLHPLVTLMAMYVGLKTIGFFGMVIFPLMLILIIFIWRKNGGSQRVADLIRERESARGGGGGDDAEEDTL